MKKHDAFSLASFLLFVSLGPASLGVFPCIVECVLAPGIVDGHFFELASIAWRSLHDEHYCPFVLIVKSCPLLANPANGAVSSPDSLFGTSATYSCNSGYKLTKSNRRSCEENGQWSGEAPSCQGMYMSKNNWYWDSYRVPLRKHLY